MVKNFTYPLPDELYIEGVSGDVVGDYVYDGPEKINVKIDSSGQVVDIDPIINEGDDTLYIVEIDANVDTAVAYMFADYFIEVAEPWNYEYEDVTMDNGDIYKKPLNPNLKDAYQVVYNIQSKTWELVQILKEPGHPSSFRVKESLETVKRYADAYEFSEEVEAALESYIQKCEEHLAKYANYHMWKYINFEQVKTPKLPAVLVSELAKVPDPLQEQIDRFTAMAQLSGGVV
jgi:hypothetical protein